MAPRDSLKIIVRSQHTYSMEAVWEYSLPMIQALQSVEWLEWPMRLISQLGSEAFFLLFISLLYWCISPRLGIRVALILLVSTSLNYALKLLFASPRPQWYSTQVRVYESETSFGMPSAHAQNAVAVWGEVARFKQRHWLTSLAIGLMLVIGISRLYLGVHFPTDVLAGWAIGLVVLWAFNRLTNPVMQRVKRYGLVSQCLMTSGTSLLLLLPSGLLVLLSGSGEMPAVWSQQLQASGGTMPQPLSLDVPVSASGTWLGFAAGALGINQHQPFHPRGGLWHRVTQYVIGITIALVIWAGLDVLFPEGKTFIAYSLRYLRYTLLGGWIAAGAPLLFGQMRRLG